MSTPRTDSTKVQGIIEVDSTISLTPFIAASHLMVGTVIGDALTDEELLTEIETWLAAHLYSIRDSNTRLSSFSAEGKISVGFQASLGQGLKATLHGQQVILLDTTGRFLALSEGGGKIRARLTAAHPTSEHPAY